MCKVELVEIDGKVVARIGAYNMVDVSFIEELEPVPAIPRLEKRGKVVQRASRTRHQFY